MLLTQSTEYGPYGLSALYLILGVRYWIDVRGELLWSLLRKHWLVGVALSMYAPLTFVVRFALPTRCSAFSSWSSSMTSGWFHNCLFSGSMLMAGFVHACLHKVSYPCFHFTKILLYVKLNILFNASCVKSPASPWICLLVLSLILHSVHLKGYWI